MLKQKTISFSMILVGFVFLINPIPMLIDILPDFIGYLLILQGISKLSHMLPDFSELQKNTKKLLYISLSKLPALYFMFLIWGSSSGQRVIATTFTLAYAIVEVIFSIPFVHSFFDAFTEIGKNFDSDVALTGTTMRPEKLEKIAVIFFSLKCAMSTIPEFALVPTYSAELEYSFNWNNLYPILAIVGILVVIGYAIYFFIPFSSYIRAISKTEGLQERLSYAVGNEIVKNRSLYAILESSTTFFILGVFLTFDVYFDSLNYIPDFFAAVAFCISLILLAKFNRAYFKVNAIFSGLYLISTIVHSTLFNQFFEVYSSYSIQHSVEAYKKYTIVLISSFASELFGIILAILFALSFFKVIENSVGMRNIHESHNFFERKIKKELQVKSVLAAVFAFLAHSMSFIYEVSLGYTGSEMTAAPGSAPVPMVIPKYEWLWPVVSLCNFIWVISALVIVTRLREESSLNLDIDS